MKKEKAMLLMLQKAIEVFLEEYSDIEEEESLPAKNVRVELFCGDTSLCVHMREE